MGGAPLPQMSAVERHRYEEGITIRCKFVGKIEVPGPRGTAMLVQAIDRVRAHLKAAREAKVKQWFVISTEGLKIIDTVERRVRDSYALHQISFIASLPSNKKVFAFVTANRSVQPFVYTAHVFKSTNKAELIINTIGQCFTLAVEKQRALQQQAGAGATTSSSSSYRSPRSPPMRFGDGGGGGGGGNGSFYGGDGGGSSYAVRLPATHAGVLGVLRDMLQRAPLSPSDADLAARATSRLGSLFDQEAESAREASREAESLHNQLQVLSQQHKLALQRENRRRQSLSMAGPPSNSPANPPPPMGEERREGLSALSSPIFPGYDDAGYTQVAGAAGSASPFPFAS